MEDKNKTKEQLIKELEKLRRRINKLEISESEYKQSKDTLEFLSSVTQQVKDSIIVTDTDFKITFVNKATENLFGYSQKELLGKSPGMLNAEPMNQQIQNEIYQTVSSGKVWSGILLNKRKDGSVFICEMKISPLFDKQSRVSSSIGIQRDVTQQKQLEESIRRLAYYDSVTGLPNRVLFNDRFNVAIAQANRNKKRLVLMMLDLDRFKKVNDNLGHFTGDQLLKGIGSRLRALLRESDTVGRMGGDEFMVLVSEIIRIEDACQLADKILKAIRKPFIFDGHKLKITTSIGIAVFPDDGEDIDTLMKNSDISLYHAKNKGRNNYQICNSSGDAKGNKKK